MIQQSTQFLAGLAKAKKNLISRQVWRVDGVWAGIKQPLSHAIALPIADKKSPCQKMAGAFAFSTVILVAPGIAKTCGCKLADDPALLTLHPV